MPGFPEADWDVLVDVRERLTRSRTSLRLALIAAAEGLVDVAASDLPEAAAMLRQRVIEPALAAIDDELDELKALPTLLRLINDAPLLTFGTSAISIAAAMVPGLPITSASAATLSGPVVDCGCQGVFAPSSSRARTPRPAVLDAALGNSSA